MEPLCGSAVMADSFGSRIVGVALGFGVLDPTESADLTRNSQEEKRNVRKKEKQTRCDEIY